MKLITKAQMRKLIANGKKPDEDHFPVVKLFTPDAQCTWLLNEIDLNDQDIAFGLCDLGMGFPELGPVRLSELREVWGKLGLPVERELWFEGKYPISVYAELAYKKGYIVTNSTIELPKIAQEKKSEEGSS